ARARQPRDLFRRVQKGRRPVQARGDRSRNRSGDLEHRHGRGDRPVTQTGRALPRQHRAGDARVPEPRAGRAARPARVRRSHHRDRIGSDDGGGQGGAPRRAGAAPQVGPRRHRQHQLADAVHDEGSLRAMPSEARRSEDRRGGDHLLVLQPGSGHGPRGFPEPQRSAPTEYGAGEALEHVAGSPPSSERSPAHMTLASIALSSLLASAPAFEADLRAVGTLPGDPAIVAAAGVTRDETSILTIENGSAFDPADRRLRVVLIGGADGEPRAVTEAGRGSKTGGPRPIRQRGSLSALPSASFDPADKHSLAGWIQFQAPDVVIAIGSLPGDLPPYNGFTVDVWSKTFDRETIA